MDEIESQKEKEEEEKMDLIIDKIKDDLSKEEFELIKKKLIT